MPWTNLLVDATAGHQVRFKVMPFGLKNARVIYQRLVNRIFKELEE